MLTVFKTANSIALDTHRRNQDASNNAQRQRHHMEAQTGRTVAVAEYPQGWCATGLIPRDQADRDHPPQGMAYDPSRDLLIPTDTRRGIGADLRRLGWEREALDGTEPAFQAFAVPYGDPARLTASPVEVEINGALWLAIPTEFARMVTGPAWEQTTWDVLECEAQAGTVSPAEGR